MRWSVSPFSLSKTFVVFSALAELLHSTYTHWHWVSARPQEEWHPCLHPNFWWLKNKLFWRGCSTTDNALSHHWASPMTISLHEIQITQVVCGNAMHIITLLCKCIEKTLPVISPSWIVLSPLWSHNYWQELFCDMQNKKVYASNAQQGVENVQNPSSLRNGNLLPKGISALFRFENASPEWSHRTHKLFTGSSTWSTQFRIDWGI